MLDKTLITFHPFSWYCKKTENIRGQLQKFKALLVQHIYSKIALKIHITRWGASFYHKLEFTSKQKTLKVMLMKMKACLGGFYRYLIILNAT